MRIRGSGSTSKWYGSETLIETIDATTVWTIVHLNYCSFKLLHVIPREQFKHSIVQIILFHARLNYVFVHLNYIHKIAKITLNYCTWYHREQFKHSIVQTILFHAHLNYFFVHLNYSQNSQNYPLKKVEINTKIVNWTKK